MPVGSPAAPRLFAAPRPPGSSRLLGGIPRLHGGRPGPFNVQTLQLRDDRRQVRNDRVLGINQGGPCGAQGTCHGPALACHSVAMLGVGLHCSTRPGVSPQVSEILRPWVSAANRVSLLACVPGRQRRPTVHSVVPKAERRTSPTCRPSRDRTAHGGVSCCCTSEACGCAEQVGVLSTHPQSRPHKAQPVGPLPPLLEGLLRVAARHGISATAQKHPLPLPGPRAAQRRRTATSRQQGASGVQRGRPSTVQQHSCAPVDDPLGARCARQKASLA
jgi:hypothetical protein